MHAKVKRLKSSEKDLQANVKRLKSSGKDLQADVKRLNKQLRREKKKRWKAEEELPVEVLRRGHSLQDLMKRAATSPAAEEPAAKRLQAAKKPTGKPTWKRAATSPAAGEPPAKRSRTIQRRAAMAKAMVASHRRWGVWVMGKADYLHCEGAAAGRWRGVYVGSSPVYIKSPCVVSLSHSLFWARGGALFWSDSRVCEWS